MTSPAVGRNPCWRHALRQSSRKLITGRLLYNLVVSTPYSEARVFSPVREAWVEQIWRMDCYPCSKSPLSTSLKWSSRKAISNTVGFSNVAVVARTWLYTAAGCLSETPAPDLSSRLTREAFSMTGYGQKTAEVWRVFLLLFELPSQANESDLPEATGVNAPEKPLLRPFSCQ